MQLTFNLDDVLGILADVQSDRLLTVPEVAVRLDVEPAEVRRWASDGLLPVERIGRQFVFRLNQIVEWEFRGLQQLAQQHGDREQSGQGVSA